jgi:hypothetical protein
MAALSGTMSDDTIQIAQQTISKDSALTETVC